MDAGEQFCIFLWKLSKKIFGNKGDVGNFSRGHESTAPPGKASLLLAMNLSNGGSISLSYNCLKI